MVCSEFRSFPGADTSEFMLLRFEVRSEVWAVLALELFNPLAKAEDVTIGDIQLIEHL